MAARYLFVTTMSFFVFIDRGLIRGTTTAGILESPIRSCLHHRGAFMLECERNAQIAANVDRASGGEPAWWLEEGARHIGSYHARNASRSGFGALPGSSRVAVGIKDTVPSPQVWSKCTHCALQYNNGILSAILFDPRGALKQVLTGETVLLSSTKWRGFFHEKPELIHGHFAPQRQAFFGALDGESVREPTAEGSTCARIVSRPVFVFSILTWQIGHLIVDVLEPLYHTMISEYGRVPLDLRPVLILEVAGQPEYRVLLEKMTAGIWENDTPFSLLKYFTSEGAIYTTDALRALVADDSLNSGYTCFTDLHLGLDISKSYYARGFDRHPHFLDPSVSTDTESRELRRHYQAFRSWLWSQLGWEHPKPAPPTAQKVVSIVRRRSSRRILNADAFVAMASRQFQSLSTPAAEMFTINDVSLEKMTFSEQLNLFWNSTVLVAQYGTAVHNCLFLRPGTILALFMQPHWCDWAWAFASQASLLDIQVHVFCDEPRPSLSHVRVRWHEMGWAQGPSWSKDANYTVDLEAAAIFLGRITASMDFSVGQQQEGRVHSVAITSSRASRQCSQFYHASFAADHHKIETGQVTWDAFGDHASSYHENVMIADEISPTIRAHIGGLTVDQPEHQDGLPLLRVKMVPEVVYDSPLLATGTEHRKYDGSLSEFLQHRPSLKLCSEVFDLSSAAPLDSPADTLANCQPSIAFNEFSTLDLHLRGHAKLVVHAWLEESNRARETGDSLDESLKLDNVTGCSLFSERLVKSDTFFVVDTALPQALSSEEFPCGSADLKLEVVMDGVARIYSTRLWETTELQRSVASFCTQWGLTNRACAVFASAVASRALAQTSANVNSDSSDDPTIGGAFSETGSFQGNFISLPPPQEKPTPGEPFVFLHHEKCAGTSLRRHIARSALQIGVVFHVPCFDPHNASGPLTDLPPLRAEGGHRASCMSFDLEPVLTRRRLAVMAGHFQWGVWGDDLPPSLRNPDGATADVSGDAAPFTTRTVQPTLTRLPQAATPRVFVMLREPVERTISLYYERLFPHTQVRLNELSNEDLAYYLTHFKGSAWSAWRDEGFQDTACRMLCGLNVHKGKAPDDSSTTSASGDAQNSAAFVAVDQTLALRRLGMVVVGLTSRWEETKSVLGFWFPWITLPSRGAEDDARANAGFGASVENISTLSTSHHDKISAVNQCDHALYAAAMKQFEHQLVVVKAAKSS